MGDLVAVCSFQCSAASRNVAAAAAAALAPIARLVRQSTLHNPSKLCQPLHAPAADHARFEAQLDHFELKPEAVVQKVGC